MVMSYSAFTLVWQESFQSKTDYVIKTLPYTQLTCFCEHDIVGKRIDFECADEEEHQRSKQMGKIVCI